MEQIISELNIPVTLGGVLLKNPFYVASGPTTKSVRQLKRIEETGWAAASIKLSIDPAPYINRRPRYSLFDDRNALAFTAEKRLTFEQGLKLIRDAKQVLTDLKLMANITYAGDAGVEGWVNMAVRFEEAGADFIELNMCCPNMSYNLETTGGKNTAPARQTGASMGQNADVSSGIVSAIKRAVKIPVIAKLTPEGGHIAQVAEALFAAGADAVGGTGNRLGIPKIDLEYPASATFPLQKEISMGCYSSGWLKPLAQRDIYEIRKTCGNERVITATGGVANWKDAVEMILCGGSLIGICSETLISGYDIVRPMIRGLKDYMDQHGYETLDQMRSKIVSEVKSASDVTLYDGFARIKQPNLAAPCKAACPHHVPAQAYVQKVAKGDYRAAYDLITGTNALQEICALVCEHPCEDACTRGDIDAPVRIREIKRFVLEYGKARGWQPCWAQSEPNGHRVAVIGAGLAGLSCASELRRAGYDVTVFEKEQKAGGSLRYVTPAFRLDQTVLDETVEQIAAAGVRFAFESALGRDISFESLKRDGYESVFLAVGAEQSQRAAGAVGAREFLTRAREGTMLADGRMLICGDDTDAIDAARTALRLGAGKSTVLLEGAFPNRTGLHELAIAAKEEGVSFLEHAVLLEAAEGGAKITIGGETVLFPCEHVIASGRMRVDCEPLAPLLNERGRIQAAAATGLTNLPGVFAGGDAVRNGSVIDAIAAAKRAAAAMDRSLRQEDATLAGVRAVQAADRERVLKRSGYIKKDTPLAGQTKREPKERIHDFAPVARVMTELEAVAEASRCLNCGCGEGCQLCKTICSEFAPVICAPDTLEITRADCVACGMCYHRCPNGNIEMVNLGVTV